MNVKRLFTNCELCNRPSVNCTVHANSHVLVLDLKLFCFQYHQNFSEPGKIFIHKTANFLPFVTINIWTISTNWAEHNIICWNPSSVCSCVVYHLTVSDIVTWDWDWAWLDRRYSSGKEWTSLGGGEFVGNSQN